MNDFIKQRSFELSYALFQLSRVMKQKDLRGRIEANAVYLLETAEGGDDLALRKAIAVLRKLVVLGEGIGEVSFAHSRLIAQQFLALNSAIAEYADIRQSDDEANSSASIDSIFGNAQTLLGDTLPGVAFNSSRPIRQDLKSQPPHIHNGSSTRQSAIVEKIRQFGNGCRMKDLIAAFPDVSERTLRYDLQRVCEQGSVERVGNGGPLTFYRVKQGVSMSIPREGVTN